MSGGECRERAWLQYQKNAAETLTSVLTSGQTLNLEISTDRGSFGNGLLDKPNATDFRALIDCAVRVYYSVTLHSNTDNDGIETDVLLNGVMIPQAQSGAVGRNSTVEPNNARKCFIVNMLANQVLQLQVTKLEITSTATFRTETTMSVEFIRRL